MITHSNIYLCDIKERQFVVVFNLRSELDFLMDGVQVCDDIIYSFSCLYGQIMIMLSTNLNHSFGLNRALFKALVSKLPMRSLAMTDDKAEAIGAPFICLLGLPLNEKYVFFRYWSASSIT